MAHDDASHKMFITQDVLNQAVEEYLCNHLFAGANEKAKVTSVLKKRGGDNGIYVAFDLEVKDP
jgi:hypothetical protein